MITDPASYAQRPKIPSIRPVTQEGEIRRVRRAFSENDPCRPFLTNQDQKIIASCYVVLDGLVHPVYRESVTEASLCVLSGEVNGLEVLSFKGNFLSEDGQGNQTRFYIDQTQGFVREGAMLRVKFSQASDRFTFEYVDQGLEDYPLLNIVRKTKVFRKRLNKAALECLPEYIPDI